MAASELISVLTDVLQKRILETAKQLQWNFFVKIITDLQSFTSFTKKLHPRYFTGS